MRLWRQRLHSGDLCRFGPTRLPIPMRLLPLLLVALLAGCAGSEPAGPPTVWGVWEGEGAQWNDGDRSHEPDVRWPLEIAVTPAASGEPTATIDYPSFPCGGTLEYVGPSREPGALPGDMVFIERITTVETPAFGRDGPAASRRQRPRLRLGHRYLADGGDGEAPPRGLIGLWRQRTPVRW